MDVEHVWRYGQKTTVKAGSADGIYSAASVETSFTGSCFLACSESLYLLSLFFAIKFSLSIL